MSQPVTTRPPENAAGAGPNAAQSSSARLRHDAAPGAIAVSPRGGGVLSIAAHTTWMTGRQLKAIARQPAYVVIMLVQPVIWLFLFGSLFRKVVDLPGFGAPSPLAPGGASHCGAAGAWPLSVLFLGWRSHTEGAAARLASLAAGLSRASHWRAEGGWLASAWRLP